MTSIILYHNPRCATSRKVLELLKDANISVNIFNYLKTPPDIITLKNIVRKIGGSVHDIVRIKEPLYRELKLDDLLLSDEEMYQLIQQHPILLNRPIIEDEQHAMICRPAESVLRFLE